MKNLFKFMTIISVVCILMGFSACNPTVTDNTQNTQQTTPILKKEFIIATGYTEKLTLPNIFTGKTVTWLSENTLIATVDENGIVKAGPNDEDKVFVTSIVATASNGNEILTETYTIKVVPLKATANIYKTLYPDWETTTNVEIPFGITDILGGTFYNWTQLSSLTVPDSVSVIAEDALRCNNLKTITLGKNVKEFGYSILIALEKIEVNKENVYLCTVDNILFNKDKTNLIRCPCKKNLKTYSIPETVKTISFRAFESSNIETVIIPNSVEEIGEEAFIDCRNLNNVKI